jgi:hypothetical protein
MTHAQRNAAILHLIDDYRKRHTRSPEAARAALIAAGLHDAEGRLLPEFGGPGWEKRSG